MKPSLWLAVALLTSSCGGAVASDDRPTNATEAALQEGERKTSTDPRVNPDAAAMADFKGRVEGYAELHRQLATGDAKQEKNTTPTQIHDDTAGTGGEDSGGTGQREAGRHLHPFGSSGVQAPACARVEG